MQHEVLQEQRLLDPQGMIREPGWARSPLWKYERADIKAHWLRIKEWDYYYILSHDKNIGFSVTISDLGYIGMMAVCFLDFTKGFSVQEDSLIILPKGNVGLPPHSQDSIVQFSNNTLSIHIETKGAIRTLEITAPHIQLPSGEIGLKASITLSRVENDESINIATSWEELRTAFYLNEKITCMGATGTIAIGEKEYTLSPNTDLGGLDWGRGRWTYKNRWYWGSTSGMIDSIPFGLNLGYGFSDRTPASENVIFYDNKLHKLEEIKFIFDTEDYMKPWKVTSSDGRCELTFTPAVDRQSQTKVLVLKSMQHQVFGYFDGFVILDDKKKIKLDHMLGFAEDVFNQW